LNLRHPAPKAGALPDCATPRWKENSKLEFPPAKVFYGGQVEIQKKRRREIKAKLTTISQIYIFPKIKSSYKNSMLLRNGGFY
jgi:hypothetical protein